MFSYKYSTYRILWIHVMENNIKISYQLMGDKKHDASVFHQENYIQAYLIISLNKCESNSISHDYL